MSIVTLKKKTQNQYNNLSVGQKQFSLQGGHRSQGFVGQTMLSRSLPRTLMVGNVPRGHGGLNGAYHKAKMVVDGTGLGNNTLNNSKVMKPSVLDTNGMIMTKYRWIRRPQPFTSVKPDTTNNVQTQQQHIEILRRLELTNQCSTKKIVGVPAKCGDLCSKTQSQYLNYNSVTKQHHISKPNPVMSQGEYITGVIDGKCSKMDSGSIMASLLQKHHFNKPFACTNVPYVTPQQLPPGASRAKQLASTTIVVIP
uniref:Uncharacterized protein n=1 Tax=viral metagenome TaxID=1070528 RepID=A0A6C0IC35_9ZZZZ